MRELGAGRGLWTAARHRVPVTWVILDNGQYGALVSHAGGVGVSKSPGNELGGLDFVGLAASMGVAGRYIGVAE
ncbi:MAG: thiamine pyrophosphate-dependent enzyme [Sciscionella sp.]